MLKRLIVMITSMALVGIVGRDLEARGGEVTECHQFDDWWEIPLPYRCSETDKPQTCENILANEIIPDNPDAQNCAFCDYECANPVPLNPPIYPSALYCTFEEVGEAHSSVCPVY